MTIRIHLESFQLKTIIFELFWESEQFFRRYRKEMRVLFEEKSRQSFLKVQHMREKAEEKRSITDIGFFFI